MEPTASALGALQEDLWRLITAPSQDEPPPGDRELAALLRGDVNASPRERLGVYANAYFARLHDCLADDFGGLARALGPEAFHDLVKTYLLIHPPAKPSLRHAGAYLADHLATPPFAEIFARRCGYAADLARLEWAIALAFSAPDAPVLAREALAEVAPDAWPALRFTATPSLHLLTCAWPVQIVRERFEREDEDATWTEVPALAAVPTAIRVWRCDERVRFAEIRADERGALEGVCAGETFSELCDRLAAAIGEEPAAARAAELLSSWIADGLLADQSLVFTGSRSG
jgi:Putative DNA-binding domain